MNFTVRTTWVVGKRLVLPFLKGDAYEIAALRNSFGVVLMRCELGLESANEVFCQGLFALDIAEQAFDDP